MGFQEKENEPKADQMLPVRFVFGEIMPIL
jgi:hypothetical protein